MMINNKNSFTYSISREKQCCISLIVIAILIVLSVQVEAKYFQPCKNPNDPQDCGPVYSSDDSNTNGGQTGSGLWGSHSSSQDNGIDVVKCDGDNLFNVHVYSCGSWTSNCGQGNSILHCPGTFKSTGGYGDNGFLGDNIESIGWDWKGAQETSQVCTQHYGGSWITGYGCCMPSTSTTLATSSAICSSGKSYVCKDAQNPVGTQQLGYSCYFDGTWKVSSSLPLNFQSQVCAYNVFKDSSADASGIYLDSSATSDTNNCCGDAPLEKVSLTVKGDQCSGTPHMKVLADGKLLYEADIGNTNYATFSAGTLTSTPQNIQVQFTNDYAVASSPAQFSKVCQATTCFSGGDYANLRYQFRTIGTLGQCAVYLGGLFVNCDSYALTSPFPTYSCNPAYLCSPTGSAFKYVCQNSCASVQTAPAVSGCDRNLYVDSIKIGSRTIQAEDQTLTSGGTFIVGGKALYGNGNIQFTVNSGGDLYSTGKGSDYNYITKEGQYVCTYNNNVWQWDDARTGTYHVKRTDAYDVISNGNNWFACNATNVGNVPSSQTFNATGLPRYTSINSGDNGVSFDYSNNQGGISNGNNLPSEGEDVSVDDFLNGVSESQGPHQILKDNNNVIFTISPREVAQGGAVTLKISGLPQGYYVANDSANKIKVSNSGLLISTAHASVTSDASSQIGYQTPFNVNLLQSLDVGSHDLSVNVFKSDNTLYKNYLLTDAFNISEVQLDSPGSAIEVNPKRFLCQRDGGQSIGLHGTIYECCGPDYSYCLTDNKDFTGISGSPTGLLKDYYGLPNKNAVHRLGFQCSDGTMDAPEARPYNEYRYTVTNLPIGNWDMYNNLEFDVFFKGSNKFNITLSTDDVDLRAGSVFNDNISKYSTTGNEINKWHHIVIPLTATMKSNTIRAIRFYIPQPQVVKSTDDCSRVSVNGNDFSMILGVDRIFLSSSNTKYCATDESIYKPSIFSTTTASSIGNWTGSLDNNEDACNNVASYHWTGTRCCGNNQNSTFSETYNDINGGCWKGQYAANNTVVRE